jgi:hypothetical protein
VGRSGAAVGIDIKPCAVELGRANVRRLAQEDREFAEGAGPTSFHLHNVFIPTAKHKGQYNKVHIGAACPPDRLASLASLLGPTGGLIVTPCGSDLRLISVGSTGQMSQKVVSQVRYSDLEVPTDGDIVAALVADHRAVRTTPPASPSSFAADCAAILGPGRGTSFASGRRRSTDSDCSAATPRARPAQAGPEAAQQEEDSAPAWVPAPMKRLTKLLTSCSSPSSKTAKTPVGSLGAASSMSSTCGMMLDDASDSSGQVAEQEGVEMGLDPAALGPADALLLGSNWELPVHWAVLRERCEHCRARSSSGMRDAGEPRVRAPDATPRAAASCFVDFLYSDRLTADPSHAQGLVDVLHIAMYFGAPRLVALAEAALASLLRAEPTADFDPVEAAPALLALADDNGLATLAVAAADFCVHAHAQVSHSQAYASLSKRQTDLITAEACAALAQFQQALQEVSYRHVLPEPDNYF